MATKTHNDPFGEELMALLNKYYYLDDSVDLMVMTYDDSPKERTNWEAFQSILFGPSTNQKQNH